MNKILLLYQEVLALEQRLKNKHILFRQYEELERELLQLESSIDYTQKDPTNPIQKKHEETDSISSIKKKLSTLNQKIDLYEDLEEDFLKSSKDRLVNELLLLFPHEKEIYTELENTYKKYESLHDKLTLVIPLFKELLHMLGLAIQSRNKLKKRGLFSFLFGRNPNADVIDFLREAEESKKKLLASLETHRSLSLISPPLSEQLDQIQTLLTEFNVNYEKVWANKSFDKELLSTTEKLFNLQEQILKEEKMVETQLNASNASIHQWQNKLIETL